MKVAPSPKKGEDFYSSATPRVQLLKHPLTSGHRGTTPAATLLPGLVMIYVSRPGLSAGPSVGHVARGSDPQLTPVCIELPFDHSFRESWDSAISGNRTKKRSLTLWGPSPLPSSTCRDSVPSPTGLTGSPLRASWLSYSRCAFFGRNPKGVTPSVPPLARSEAPHARLVEQTLRDFHPIRSEERSRTPEER